MRVLGVFEESERTATDALECNHGEGVWQIGSFVGSDEAKKSWLEERAQTWVAGVKDLTGFARASPQKAYYGLMMSLHKEWNFSSASPKGVGPLFAPLEAALRSDFILGLLRENREEVTD